MAYVKNTNTALTRIHLSPYRPEIDKLIKTGVPRTKIAAKYAPLFEMKPVNFYKMMQRYEKNKAKHVPVSVSQIAAPAIIEPGKGYVKPTQTIEDFAARLLDIGIKMSEENPEKVTMKDIIAAQKLIFEKAKLKIDEQSLMLNVARLFGGFGAPNFDGNIDGTITPGSAEKPDPLFGAGLGNTLARGTSEVDNQR